ncbi:MAG: class I SAM-dependent rRNA methyltransferase [Sphingobacteriaceae bacterium]|nr:class I SAM-dependent rRNA methyltransferase [Sphingobacteriaceae bacterium]
MTYPKITLHKGKETSPLRRHPWIFSGAMHKKEGEINEGSIVEIYSAQNAYLATGYFANGSIAIRILSFKQVEIDKTFWIEKISKAKLYRALLPIQNENTNVYRLFFGEGDGAPGLIIDNYNGHLVIQAHSYGIYLQRQTIAEALQEVFGSSLKSIYDKSAETLPKQFAPEAVNGFIVGAQEEVLVKENGHIFKIDFVNGQKTGFFIDQRENRKLLAKYSQGKTVLNTFSYTGGFSVYAAKNGATQVESIDISKTAIDLCNKNIELNNCKNHSSYAIDTFEFLKDKKDLYDIIVLDPPAFAKNRDSKHNAVQAYKRLNATALKLIKTNGLLFTFSCSGVVDKFLFYNTITASAIESGRNVKILHYLNQPADHPVIPFFPEGEYLKGMVLWVE